jgi:hypothetical protein
MMVGVEIKRKSKIYQPLLYVRDPGIYPDLEVDTSCTVGKVTSDGDNQKE